MLIFFCLMAHGKSGGLKLKLCWTIRFVFLLIMCILRHCTCCFLPVIKAVLYPNDCRGVHAWKCIFNYFVKYVVFSRTCVLSGTALVSFLTTSERCEGYKAWGLSTTVTVTCVFRREMKLLCLFIPDGKSAGLKLKYVTLTCMGWVSSWSCVFSGTAHVDFANM